jgi:vacuolar-type H+-ATPase subunit H
MTEPRESETPEERLASARSWAKSVEPSQAPRPGAASSEMSARVQTVIEAAERAADAIRYDAEEQARQHLAAAQKKADRMTAERVRLISHLTDDLIEQASVVREHSEEMVSSLQQAIDTVSKRLDYRP